MCVRACVCVFVFFFCFFFFFFCFVFLINNSTPLPSHVWWDSAAWLFYDIRKSIEFFIYFRTASFILFVSLSRSKFSFINMSRFKLGKMLRKSGKAVFVPKIVFLFMANI